MARILIAGCGYVGTELAKLVQGHEVYAIKRKPFSLAGVTAINADLTTLTMRDLPGDLDYVFYLASADAGTQSAYHQAYYLGLQNLLKQLPNSIKRIFFSSSTSVYGQLNGEWVDEGSATHPLDYKGEILLAAEQLLQASDLPFCIVRFAGIYGPGRGQLIQAVAQAKAELSIAAIYTNRIHLADCAGTLAYLMQQANLEPLYLAVDHEPALKNEVLAWLAQQLSVQLSVTKNASTQELSLRANKRCSNRKLIQAGYRFIYPSYRSGYLAQINA